MSTLLTGLIRIGAIARKEMLEILRQPKSLITLILGPFLILLLFGIGYRGEGRSLRALVVTPASAEVQQLVREHATALGPQLSISGISTNAQEARTKLKNQDVDLVLYVADNAFSQFESGKQSVITIFHNEVDPYQVDYVEFIGQLYTDKLNRKILAAALEQKKRQAGTLEKDLAATTGTIQKLRAALEQEQNAEVQMQRQNLRQQMFQVESKIERELLQSPGIAEKDRTEVQNRRTQLNQKLQTLMNEDPQKSDAIAEASIAAEMEKDLIYLRTRLNDFRRIDTKSVLAPFQSKASSIAKSKPELPQFFVPGVIVLLLQHLAITFSGLSLVREFRTGAAEIFRVSPLRPFELMAGKYLGYFMISVLIAAALTAALFFGLQMPVLGDLRYLGLVVAVLLFSSMSIGFLFSLLSNTETQAIQFTMIFLLVSIFFSGFLLNLELLWGPIRVISWLLPATYGIRLSQDIILRGELPDFLLLAILLCLGAYFFVVSYRILRQRIMLKA